MIAAAAAALQLLPPRRGRCSRCRILAGALTASSLVVMGGAAAQLAAARTTISPHHPARSTALVSAGVFAHSRNPIYLGIAGLLLAHAASRGTVLGAVPVGLFVVVLDRTQIPAEEAALIARFGEEFARYADRVPRWL